MSGLPSEFSALYVSALRDHLVREGEDPLHQAYALGRQALALGAGVLDLVMLHHAALASVRADGRFDDGGDALARAETFLVECFSPFEMSLRGYQESNAELTRINAELVTANAAVAVAHDRLMAEIEERERAEEALHHAQKLQAIGLLAGGVAHHFNNLLTIVLGNLELARRRVTDEAVDRLLLSARHGAERGAQVTRQLLTFSRQQMLQPRSVDPAAWLVALVSLLGSSLRGDISVETHVDGPPWPIEVDPSQLDLAVLNLAVNARDAMPGGGVLRLSVGNRHVEDDRLGLHGDYVVITVADTGQGIAPDLLSRVFEPFFTTKEGGPGAGLGLSQVHGFVHQSGGAIDIASVVGKGTDISLYMPASKRAPAAASDIPAPVSEGAVAGNVLIVDDDAEVAELAAELLRSCGYTVRLAYRAQAALDIVESGEPVDLVFSDVIMPGGMNGVQLAETLHRSHPAMPILLATGYSDAIATADAKGLAVIAKPYRGEDLRARIDALLHPPAA